MPSVVGRITPEIASRLPLNKQGDILLDDEGLAHIEESHGQQIRDTGFTDARAFVAHVLGNVGAVYQGKTNRTFELVSVDEKPNNRVITRLEFEEDGDFYRVKTAGPVKPSYYKNKTPLWERAHSTLFQEENPLATRRALQRGQSSVVSDVNISVGGNNVNPRGRTTFLGEQAEQSLREDAAAWGVQVESIATSGKVPSSPVQMLKQTPLVMQMLGAKERPVYAAPHLFDGTHPNITADMLKGLPQALADPIAIFQSKSHQDRLVFMLEMTDAKGATVVVPVHLDGTKHHTTIHIATTVYAKERKGNPDNAWFEKQAGNALYVNRQKEKRWLMFSGSNSLWNAANALSGKNIRTEADLVNLQQANPSLYQDGRATRGRITFTTPSGRPLITLFQQADASTFLHESGHLYLEMIKSLGTAQNAVPELAAMWKETQEILERTTGQSIVDDFGNIITAAHEKWASSLENYFRKGEAPSIELRDVFQKFGAWLKAIYN